MRRLSILSILLLIGIFAFAFALFAWLHQEAFFFITGPILGAMLGGLIWRRDPLALVTGGAAGGLCQGITAVMALKHGYILSDITMMTGPLFLANLALHLSAGVTFGMMFHLTFRWARPRVACTVGAMLPSRELVSRQTERQPGTYNTERRFLMSDAIVLVGVAALMLSADRAVEWLWRSQTFSSGPLLTYDTWEWRWMSCSLALASMSLPLLCWLLLRPVDRRRLRGGAPGLFVHPAVATAMVVRAAGWAAESFLASTFVFPPVFYDIPSKWELLHYLKVDLRRDASIAVLAAWLVLAIVGRWKPERAWDDRLGRLVGVLWVLFYLGARLFALAG